MLESFWSIALGGAVGALLRGSLLRLRMTTPTPPMRPIAWLVELAPTPDRAGTGGRMPPIKRY